MGRTVKGLKELGISVEVAPVEAEEATDKINIVLPLADKLRYAYLCAKKGKPMTKDLAEYIRKTIKREKKNIPEIVEKKICNAVKT